MLYGSPQQMSHSAAEDALRIALSLHPAKSSSRESFLAKTTGDATIRLHS
jgi:hypothetical protein